MVPGPRSDDEHLPIAACHQDLPQVGDGSSEPNLVNNDDLSRNVVQTVFLFRDGGELAVSVGTAKTRIVQTVDHNRRLIREAATNLQD
jgi:hypothetical protein